MKHKSRVKPRSKPSRTMSKEYERAVKTMAKGAGIVFFGITFGYFLNFLTRLITARLLGPEEYGLFNLGLAIFNICSVFSILGLADGISRYISFFSARKELEKIKGVIFSPFKIVSFSSIFISFSLFLLSDNISYFFKIKELSTILKIFSVGIIPSAMFMVSLSSLRGLKYSKYKVYTQDILYPIFKLTLITSFIYLGFKAIGAATGYIFSVFILSILTFYFLNKKFPLFSSLKPSPLGIELLRFSLPLLLSTVLGTIMGWIDTTMIGFFIDASKVGIYNAARPVAMLLMLAINSLGFIFLPIISEMHSKKMNIDNIYKCVTKWAFVFNLPLFFSLLFFPDVIIGILFGGKYKLATVPLTILSLGYLSYTFSFSYSLLIMIKKTKVNLLITVLSAIANFSLNLILIPLYGVEGAAIATTFSMFLFNLLSILFSYFYLKIHPFSFNLIKIFIASLISSAIFYFVYRSFNFNKWFFIPCFVIFLIFSYFLFLAFRTLSKEDILILNLLRKKFNFNVEWIKRIIKNLFNFFKVWCKNIFHGKRF